MKIVKVGILPIFLAVLVAGCGGASNPSPSNSPVVSSYKELTPHHKAVATDYNNLVQQLYIAYFGRPADPQGLSNFETQLLNDGAPTDIQDLNTAYGSNASIQALVNSFGTSAESIALYGSGNSTAQVTTFVTAIFQNVLGRPPQQAGLTFWVNAITGNTLTQADAALSIAAGAQANTSAQGLIDAALIANRVAVASDFTSAVTTPGEILAYAGSPAAAAARAMLATVNSTTAVSGFQSTVSTTVTTLVTMEFTAIQAIVTQRCIPCHSAVTGSMQGFNATGLAYDTPAEIAQHATVMDTAIQSSVMPLNNETGMTSAERATFNAWYLAGANE